MNKNIEYLDPNLEDIELMNIWNTMYDEYGYMIGDFKSKWEREKLGTIKDCGDKKDESKFYKPLKIDWIEKKKNIKFYNMG